MDNRGFVHIICATLLVGITGVLAACDVEGKGPPFIAGDHPVTEGQIRQRLQSEGYSNIQIVHQGETFAATGSKDGATGSIVVDAQSGRLVPEGENDDD
ncbi:hypothetical protein [Mesorhizobium captivum]|uniref:hypothetical protein n=1 Tax=Mesorhizobium captivum TaxID=3072319 RepID=UPI002A249DB5|nr:hypothetical protein [Mesorhizobium sp. VK23E]MDX8512147.1 hypothetical protein [Mesorhizobium sp. VK23E]